MKSRPLRILAVVILALAVLAFSTIGRLDRNPGPEEALSRQMWERMSSIPTIIKPTIEYEGDLEAGWSRINITPGHPMPMAGYAPRKAFQSVHDSLFARVISLRNSGPSIAFISVDLLIFPPMLRDRLHQKMDSADVGSLLYLAATHTHNGVGGWDDSFIGQRALGKFNATWVESTANGLLKAITEVEFLPAQITYWQSDASELVENRADRENGKTDGIVRGVELARSDGSAAILYTFSAHPTSLDRHSLELSGDYPAAVTDLLENRFDFAMFMAGMVGSHRFVPAQQSNYDFLEHVGPVLEEKVTRRLRDDSLTSPRLRFTTVPIEFGPSQVRVAGNWTINDWLFRSLLRPLKGDAVKVEIGNIIFIGLPCDFSGELYSVGGLGGFAESLERRLIITSFNGDYVGYITLDKHYDTSQAEEIRTLNWVGPGYGEYFTTIIKGLVGGTELDSIN